MCIRDRGNGVLQDILWNAGIDPRFDMREAEEEDFRSLYDSVTGTLRQMCDGGGREDVYKRQLKVKELSDRLVEQGDYHPTYFEFLFLMGMLIFDDEDVDIVVLETGLGGRLDATNSCLLYTSRCV